MMIPLKTALFLASLEFYGTGQWLGSPEAPLTPWDELLMAYVDGEADDPIFIVANSDSHNTGDPGSTVGVAKNGVYVRNTLNHRQFFKALEAGRSFATTGPSLDFAVNGKLMGEKARISNGSAEIGFSVTSESASYESVTSESPTAIILQIDVIKNGEVWETINPMAPDYATSLVDEEVTEDGYYRIEVTAVDTVTGAVSFAWSNPVFVFVE